LPWPAAPGAKTNNDEVRALMAQHRPLIVMGSINEKMYLAELKAAGHGPKPAFIPGELPGRGHPARHRHTLHGLRRRDLLLARSLQRAVRCAFPHPAAGHGDGQRGRDTHDAAPRHAHGIRMLRRSSTVSWPEHPMLTRISAAKTIRDAAEKAALESGAERVIKDTVKALAPAGFDITEGE
jgi:chlorophyllide a reductase subunit Z